MLRLSTVYYIHTHEFDLDQIEIIIKHLYKETLALIVDCVKYTTSFRYGSRSVGSIGS